jgi:hypothetical protein
MKIRFALTLSILLLLFGIAAAQEETTSTKPESDKIVSVYKIQVTATKT